MILTYAQIDQIVARHEAGQPTSAEDIKNLQDTFADVRKQSLTASRTGNIRQVAKLSAVAAKINSVLQQQTHMKEAAYAKLKALRGGLK